MFGVRSALIMGGRKKDRVVSGNSLALGSVILCIFQRGEREREGKKTRERRGGGETMCEHTQSLHVTKKAETNEVQQ